MKKMRDIGRVARGKTTGCNDFFVLSIGTVQKYRISAKYLQPVISSRTPDGCLSDNVGAKYLLDVVDTKTNLRKTKSGQAVLKYIEAGERNGVHKLSTVKSRQQWYSLGLQESFPIFLSRIAAKRVKIYQNNDYFYTFDQFVNFEPANQDHIAAYLAYFASSWFSLYMEIHGHKMGGGALAFQVLDYKNSPVPDFSQMDHKAISKMTNAWEKYCNDRDRVVLDEIVLTALGFERNEKRQMIDKLKALIKERMSSKKSSNA